MVRIICTECKNAYLENRNGKLICPSCNAEFDEASENLLLGVQYYNEEIYNSADDCLMKYIVKNGADPTACLYKALLDAKEIDEDVVSLSETYAKILNTFKDIGLEKFPQFIAIANDEMEKLEKALSESRVRLLIDADAEKLKKEVEILLNIQKEATDFRENLKTLAAHYNENTENTLSLKLSHCFFIDGEIAKEVGDSKFQRIYDSIASHTVFTGILSTEIKNLEIYYRCIVMFFRKSHDKYEFLHTESNKFTEIAEILEDGQYNTIKGTGAVADKLKGVSYEFLEESYKEHFDENIDEQAETVVVIVPEKVEVAEEVTEETVPTEEAEEVAEETEPTEEAEVVTEETETIEVAEEVAEETEPTEVAEEVTEETEATEEAEVVTEETETIEVAEEVAEETEPTEVAEEVTEETKATEEAEVVTEETEAIEEAEEVIEETEPTEEAEEEPVIIEEVQIIDVSENTEEASEAVTDSEEASEKPVYIESERKIAKREKRAKERKAKSRKFKILISLIIVLVLIVLGIKYVPGLIDGYKYNKALELMNSKSYTEAIEVFKGLSGYEDSESKLNECTYLYAESLENQEKYAEAKAVYESLGEYQDALTKVKSCTYNEALLSLGAGNYDEAQKLFESLEDYGDSKEKIAECTYQKGLSLLENKEYESAIEVLTAVKNYSDSAEKINEAKYGYVTDNFKKDNKTTVKYLNELAKAKFRNSAELKKELLGDSAADGDIVTVVNYSADDVKTNLTNLEHSKKIYFHATVKNSDLYGEKLTVKYTTAYGYSEKTTVTLSSTDNVAVMSYPATSYSNYKVTFELTKADGTVLASQTISF
ncbi:MAG: hypothetical protein ACI4IF_03675 [Acutalibacteraceae bacterium]